MSARDLDEPTEDVLECVKGDIALYEETCDPDDLVDALRGIHCVLERITTKQPALSRRMRIERDRENGRKP
jgi:hypothetical protein